MGVNTTAIAFYEGLGYGKVAHLVSYYGRELHVWKMAKALDARPLRSAYAFGPSLGSLGRPR